MKTFEVIVFSHEDHDPIVMTFVGESIGQVISDLHGEITLGESIASLVIEETETVIEDHEEEEYEDE